MDLEGLLAPDAANFVIGVADAAIASSGECARYKSALRAAVAAEPPPFGTASYVELHRQAATDPYWMAVSLIANAEREGDGAKRLWSLSACSPDSEDRACLKRHAIDESRHALIYLRLLDLAFPGLTDPAFRRDLQQLSPHYAARMAPTPVEGSPYAKPVTIDDFIQMNVAEIRTAIHHLLQRRALRAITTPETYERMSPILEALLRDELAHVAYTARLIEQRAARSQVNLPALFRQRLRRFNQITVEELGDHAFDCSVACCEKRPACRARAAPVFADAPL